MNRRGFFATVAAAAAWMFCPKVKPDVDASLLVTINGNAYRAKGVKVVMHHGINPSLYLDGKQLIVVRQRFSIWSLTVENPANDVLADPESVRFAGPKLT